MAFRHRCSSCNRTLVWITRPPGRQLVCINANCTTGHQPAATKETA